MFNLCLLLLKSFGFLLIRQTTNQVSIRIKVIVVSESAEDLLLSLADLRLLGLSRRGLYLCL